MLCGIFWYICCILIVYLCYILDTYAVVFFTMGTYFFTLFNSTCNYNLYIIEFIEINETYSNIYNYVQIAVGNPYH